WRMSEVHAAIGLVQLRRLDEFVATRRAVAACYDELLARAPGISPLAMPFGCEPNYYKYVAILDASIGRAQLQQEMRTEHGGALSGEVYPTPLTRQPVFEGYGGAALPVAEDVCTRHVCLPIHSDMTADEAEYVAQTLQATLTRLSRASRTRSA